MKRQIIPIFYACDDAFIKYTIVSLDSMIKNASSDYNYDIHILSTTASCEMVQKTLSLQNDNFKISFDDVSGHLEKINKELPVRDYYSKTTYYRMFISEMFPALDKAIYIDSDTVVQGDISELYNQELYDNLVGAAHEQAMVQIDEYGTYVEQNLGIDRNNYFNAGVMLINCKKFRDERVLEQFLKLLSVYNFAVTQDEDYLNVICKDRVLWIDGRWNTEMIGDIPYGEHEYKIIHYIMTSKPWHYKDCRCGNFLDFIYTFFCHLVGCEQRLDVCVNFTDSVIALVTPLREGEVCALRLPGIKINAKLFNQLCRTVSYLKRVSVAG